MRASKTLVRLGVASVLIGASGYSILEAQDFLFAESLAQLSNADREAMERARRDVLGQMKQGAVSVWKDDTTGHSGEARLRRTYEQNGLMCAEVDHIIRIPSESRYVIPFCRVGDGTWRVAF